MPAATPTLAFCLTTLPRPGNRPVERAEQVVDVLRLDARRDTIERRLRHTLLQHFLDTERRNDLLDPGHRHLQFTVETALAFRPSVPVATATRSPCAIRDCTISTWPPAAWISRNRSGQGFGEKSFRPAQQRRGHRRRTARPATDATPEHCRHRSAAPFRSRDDPASSLPRGGRAVRHVWRAPPASEPRR